MMTPKRFRRLCVVALFATISLPITVLATFTDTVSAGYLYSTPYSGTGATTPPGKIASGALLLLVAAGGNNGTSFTATPNAGQYVAGGDTVLGAAAYNYNLSSGGGTSSMGTATQSTFTNLASAASGTTIYMELRWYPNITYSQYLGGTVPAAGMYFGEYNPLVTNSSGNTILNPDGGATWTQQTDGTYSMNLYTTDLTAAPSHTQAVSEGYANFVVPVPEPSVGVLAGLGLVVAAGAARAWRRSAGSNVGA